MPTPVPVNPGQRFGRLVVQREEASDHRGRRLLCKCDCGTVKVVTFKQLRTGITTSCGCVRREMVACKNTVHGLKHLPEYGHWKVMRQRCKNPGHSKYPMYGAKGITVCAAWDDFAVFLKDVGRMPSPEHSLDRYPNRAGNYEPGNVRWATDSEQMRNRDSTVMVVFRGEEMPMLELAERFGIRPATLYGRLRRGWSVERAVATPAKLGNNQYGTH